MRRFLLALLLLPLIASGASATSCVPSTPQEDLARADVVFRGTVIKLDYPYDGGTVATFQVESMLKGAPQPTAQVWTSSGRARVVVGDPDFRPGETWQVYATKDARRGYTTGPCTGTQRLSEAALPGAERPGLSPWLYAGFALAAIAATAFFLMRRRRQS